MSSSILSIGLYLFDDVEVLDFAGPYEVFTTAARVHAREAVPRDLGAAPLFRVHTIGRTRAKARARAGLEVWPDFAIDDHPPLDVLVVPGGVVTAEMAKPDVVAWIAAQSRRVQITASVCTGAFLLARAGLLDGLCATTHWEDLDDLRAAFPAVTVRPDPQQRVRWIDEGAQVTSGGISAGIDMSLHLVERLHDRALALGTARQMAFDWTENP